MGVVYRAFDRRRGEVVALKTLQNAEASLLYRFKQEFRGFADIVHPNLVALHELVSDGSVWFFTMEFVEGVAFVDAARAEPARLRALFLQLADGLAALHAAGKVHRDIKPSNVLVARDGRVVLLDFGLGTDVVEAGDRQSTHAHVVGTVAYMAPEQASARAVGPAGDWYAVGVMLFEALTGSLPFIGDPLQVLLDKRSVDPPSPSSVASGVPEDLDLLCADLLRRDPAARPGAAEVRRRLGATAAAESVPTPAAAHAAPARIVGRSAQLAALAAAFAATRERRSVVVHVRGRSGIGKSALVQTFLEDVARRGEAVILFGRCYERESVPYKAFDTPIDALSRHLSRLPEVESAALLPRDVGALTRLFPVLRRVPVVARAPQRLAEIPDPHEARRRAVQSLRELLARMGDRHPLVLAIDDLQWGDADSAALLVDLLRPPDAPVVMLILSSRSEDTATSPFLSALGTALDDLGVESSEILLEPLSADESAQLAASRLGGTSAASRAAAIAREAGGNPFFVLALAEHARAGLPLDSTDSGSGTLSLENVLMDRIQRLPDDARRLLETVAVAGRPVPVAVAARATALEAGGRAALAALRSARLARLAGSGERGDLDTYHDRVRETTLAHLDPARLRSVHERLAASLDAEGNADPEVLARHLTGAGRVERAAECIEQAAAKATKALAFDHAVELYTRAISLGGTQGAARMRLLRALAEAQANARRAADAAQSYVDAAALADGIERLDLTRRAGEQLLIAGRVDDGLRVLRPLLASFGVRLASGNRHALVRMLLRRARLRIRGLSYRLRRQDEIAPRELLRVDTVQAVAHYLSHYDSLHAIDLQSLAVRAALDAGEPRRLVRALVVEGVYTALAGSRSRRRTERLLRIADSLVVEVGDPWAQVFVAIGRGFSAFMSGRWRVAENYLFSSLPTLRERCTGVAWEVDETAFFGLMALEFLGEMRRFRELLDHALADATRRGDRFSEMLLRLRICPMRSLLDDAPDQAAEGAAWSHHERSRQQFDVPQFYVMQSAADVALYSGRGAEAREILGRAASAYGRSLLSHVDLLDTTFSWLTARSSLAAACAPGTDPATSKRRIAEAESHARRLARRGEPYQRAWALSLRAGAAAARGRRADCLALLSVAEEAFHTADMPLYAEVMRLRRGETLGGEAGCDLAAEAAASMTARTVRNPARWADLYAPGFRRAGG
jgi:hypothetical protein